MLDSAKSQGAFTGTVQRLFRISWVILLLALASVAGAEEPTLSEVEPRTPVSNAPYVIKEPGSYYLTSNMVGGWGLPAITIIVDNVTLDLNGFEIYGGEDRTGDTNSTGIYVQWGHGVLIKNGTMRNWHESGVTTGDNTSGVLTDLRVVKNFHDGFVLAGNWTLKQCMAVQNGRHGFLVDGSSNRQQVGCTFIRCTAAQNSGDGFKLYESTLRECTATLNGERGFEVWLSRLDGCTASRNWWTGIVARKSNLSECMVVQNSSLGVQLVASLMRNCTVINNGSTGIDVNGDSFVVGNLSVANDKEGINVPYVSGNRIEENHVQGNGMGITANVAGNLVRHNSATENTGGNYDLAEGNQAFVDNQPEGPETADLPYVNFEH